MNTRLATPCASLGQRQRWTALLTPSPLRALRARLIVLILRILWAIFATAAIGHTALALPVVEITEVMMEAQGTDTEFIARLYEPDAGVSLLSTSDVDPAASRYDYALASGST